MASERLNKLLAMEQAKPNDAFLKFAIAQEHVNAGNDKLALPYFKTISDIQPAYVPLYYHLGKLYERLDLLPQARETFSTGITVAKAANDFKTAGELNEALTLLEDE